MKNKSLLPKTLLILTMLMSMKTFAQVSTGYVFSSSSGVYTPITGGTVVFAATTSATGDPGLGDDQIFTLAAGTIPFTFTFNGVGYTGLRISTNGFITFGTTAPATNTYNPTSATVAYAGSIAAIGRDMSANTAAGNLGEIRYQVLGTAPSRRFVIQYARFRRYSSSSTLTENYNFQIVLNETTNRVDIIYGPATSTTTSTTSGPSVGLRGATNTDFNIRTNTTSWASSTAGTAATAFMRHTTTINPASGLTYTWSLPAPCSGTPAPGNTVASINPVCPGGSTTLSLQNFTSGTGVTYQWKANGTPIGGANAATFVASPSSATTYTCDVTCAGNTGTSNGLLVNVSAPFSVTTSTPYFEGAEGITPPAVPTCMTLTNAPTSSTAGTGSAARTGTRWFRMSWTPFANKYIISAPLALTSGNTFEASAWYLTDGVSGWGTFRLYYNTTPSVVGATQITTGTPNAQVGPNPITTSYQKLSGSFVAPSTGTYFVIIEVVPSSSAPTAMSWDDFEVRQLVPCSGTPTVGAVAAALNPVCVGVSNTISVANQAALVALNGLSYQWDTSINGTTWAPKIASTNVNLVVPNQTTGIHYRLNVTCANSGLSGTSNSLLVNMDIPTNCYCTPVATSGCVDGDVIARVKLNKLDNNSGTGCPSSVPLGCTLGTCTSNGGYSNYTTNAALRDTLQPATTYGCQVWAGQYGENYRVWIDYNDDGFFDNATESVGFTTTTVAGSGSVGVLGSSATFPISLACTPPAGLHRMRVRCVFGLTNGSTIDPCATVSYGETEDYQVYITPAAPCIPAGALNASKVGTFVDTLTWVKNCANTNNYDFQYGPAGFTLGSGTIVSNVNAPDSSYILTGLLANTTYDVYYRTNCGGGSTSGWSPKYTFTTLPSCFPPTGITPGAPTGTSCSVSWTPNPLNPSSAYRYFINTTGVAPTNADPGIAVTATSVNITGLTPTTQYYVWVKSNCGGGDFSVWSASATFTTVPCIPVYTIGTTSGDLISKVQIVGTSLNNNTGFTAGTPSFVNYYNSTLANQTALLQPSTNYDLVISTGEWGDQNFAAWIDYNDDGIFSTPSERIGFTPVRIGSGLTTGVINASGTFTISLACTPPPGPHRMRIRGVYSTTNIGSTIDPCSSQSYGETEDYKITIAPANSCPSGGILTATAATTNSVTLKWTTGCATATAWDFEYGPAGFTLGTGTRLSAVPADTIYLLTGLLSGVNYDVYMRASCSATSKSFWSNKANFNTICQPPTALTTLSVTNNTMLKNWTPGRAEPSWDVFVSTSATTPLNTTVGTYENITRPFNVTGLMASTQYYTWVRAQCHSKDSSVWSAMDTTKTLTSAPDSLIFQVNPNTLVFKSSTTTGISASGRPGCGSTVADDDKFFTCTKPAGVTKMYVLVNGSANFDPAFEVMTGGFPNYTSLACVNQNSNSVNATESFLIEGLPSAQSFYTIRVYDARTGSGSGAFTIAAYTTKFNVTNIVPCNSVSSSNNTGQVAGNPALRTAFDNGIFGGTNTNLTTVPPSGPNLIYYTGTTAFAPFTVGAPLPSCGTTTANPKRVFYSFRAPTVGGVSVEIRSDYPGTSASTILEAMSATGVPCPTSYNPIKCSTTGILTLTDADLAPFAGQLIYVQLTQNAAANNAIQFMMSMQANAPAITADSATNNGFRIVLPATAPTNLSKYRVFWRTTGSTGFSFIDLPATATSYKLSNLNSGVSYDAWVAYYSSINTQIYNSEKISISTLAGCSGTLPAPTAGPNPSSPSCTKALITWPSFPLAGTAFKYRFYYRLTSSAGYSVVALNDTFIYLNNLTLSAGYQFFYKAICASSGSAVSSVSTMYTNCNTPKTGENPLPAGPITINGITYDNADFRDLVAATEEEVPVDGEWHEINLKTDNSLTLSNNINLYPNPTSDFVTVDYLAIPKVDAKLTLTSIEGKTISSSLMNDENAFLVGNTNRVRLKTKLDLRNHQPGIYVVTVSQEGNIESKQLIIIK